MTKRRDFNRTLAGAAIAVGVGRSFTVGTASAQASRVPRKNTLMRVGGDYHSVAGQGITSKENLEYNLRCGVKHLTAQVKKGQDGAWDLDELRRMKDACDKYGLFLEAIRMDSDYIMLPKGPEREREADAILGNIERASKVGIQVITYHWTVIPIRRNRQTPGRGNVSYSGFKLEDNWKELPTGKAGRVSAEDYWERITYFLQRAIPVARQFDVRMACHPYDPPGLPSGYQGADNWDSPPLFEAIKRYEKIVDSPYNGFQLCLGTAAEGLKKPATEILPIVEYLAERKKIHQIHMRNIRGGLHDFEEVYPDEGEMDFFQVMRILRDLQYDRSILPDHMPRHRDDPRGLQSFAFGYGYLKALIQAANSEVRG